MRDRLRGTVRFALKQMPLLHDRWTDTLYTDMRFEPDERLISAWVNLTDDGRGRVFALLLDDSEVIEPDESDESDGPPPLVAA